MEGGRMQCFMKKEDKSLINLEEKFKPLISTTVLSSQHWPPSRFPDCYHICWSPHLKKYCCHHVTIESLQPSDRSWPHVLQHVWEDPIWSRSLPCLCCIESILWFHLWWKLVSHFVFPSNHTVLRAVVSVCVCLRAVFLDGAIEKKLMCDIICCWRLLWVAIPSFRSRLHAQVYGIELCHLFRPSLCTSSNHQNCGSSVGCYESAD